VKLLEENRGKTPQTSLANDFLAMTPKAQSTKTKLDQWNYKLEHGTAKKTIYRVKR
jgi:hypothetical protein